MISEETLQRLGESLRYVGECFCELIVAIGDALSELAEAVSEILDTFPYIVEELQEIAEKPSITKPPRMPVRHLGGIPQTKYRPAMRTRIRTGHRHT